MADTHLKIQWSNKNRPRVLRCPKFQIVLKRFSKKRKLIMYTLDPNNFGLETHIVSIFKKFHPPKKLDGVGPVDNRPSPD